MIFDPNALRRSRRNRDLTLVDVGDAVGQDNSRISRFEQGLAVPRADVLAKWLAFLDVNPSDVFVNADPR